MKIYISFILVFFTILGQAQNDHIHIGSDPKESSAIFQADSQDQGMLITKVSSQQKLNIVNPELGHMVYDTDTKSFWFYNDVIWVELAGVNAEYIHDQDIDTKIWTQKNGDEDILRFDASSANVLTMQHGLFNPRFDSNLLFGSSLTGAGSRMYYDYPKHAFRMGTVSGQEWDPTNLGFYSLAFGNNTLADNTFSMAWGNNNQATGYSATAWGNGNLASGTNSTTWGQNNIASGQEATAWGYNNLASGTLSTAWGIGNIASAQGSTAFGALNESGYYGTSWGVGSKATGSNSTAFGDVAKSPGHTSLAIGKGVIAASTYETAVGKYNEIYTPSPWNWIPEDVLFSVGTGTSSSFRKNGFTIYKSGDVKTINEVEITSSYNSTRIDFFRDLSFRYAFDYYSPSDYMTLNSTMGGTNIWWTQSGSVSFGSFSSPVQKLTVYGNASKSSSGAWLANSDRRLKKNIQTISPEVAMHKIKAMQGVSFEWNDTKTGIKRPDGRRLGFIAQELEPLFPNLINEDSNGFLCTAYGEYDPLFVETFKKQQINIENLNTDIETLNNDLNLAKAEKESLEVQLLQLQQKAIELIQTADKYIQLDEKSEVNIQTSIKK